MTRLDAAARFKFVVELAYSAKMLAANREQATTAFTTSMVVPTVVDRDAAVVRAPSEFSIVAAKPVDSVSYYVWMIELQQKEFRWVNSPLNHSFGRNHAF